MHLVFLLLSFSHFGYLLNLSPFRYKELSMHWPPMKIDILDRVKHPNLVRMFDLIISPDEILVIMELIDGGEMFDFCEV